MRRQPLTCEDRLIALATRGRYATLAQIRQEPEGELLVAELHSDKTRNHILAVIEASRVRLPGVDGPFH